MGEMELVINKEQQLGREDSAKAKSESGGSFVAVSSRQRGASPSLIILRATEARVRGGAIGQGRLQFKQASWQEMEQERAGRMNLQPAESLAEASCRLRLSSA
jgi:hypothetical protein